MCGLTAQMNVNLLLVFFPADAWCLIFLTAIASWFIFQMDVLSGGPFGIVC